MPSEHNIKSKMWGSRPRLTISLEMYLVEKKIAKYYATAKLNNNCMGYTSKSEVLFVQIKPPQSFSVSRDCFCLLIFLSLSVLVSSCDCSITACKIYLFANIKYLMCGVL